jgi:inhibitor of cysteine peptidase
MSTKTLWRMGIVLALFGALLLAAACGSNDSVPSDADSDQPVVLGAEDNGEQVQLASGQVLEVTLESNPTTGYSWEVSDVDGTVLSQVGEAEFQEAPKESEEMVGVGGTETFRFSAAAGETTLTLVYHRPWEEDVEPLETYTVDVVVR